tara:strand:+ start:119 stop:670 length:552 start_codon:yes stop_codon:yes gene_type:complete
MADTLNTDVAKELNITARRNDTFKMLLEVRDSNNVLQNFTGNSVGALGHIWQAKMSILTTSGDAVLNIYSEQWRNAAEGATASDPDGDGFNYSHPSDTLPEATTEGHYTGGTGASSAIHLAAQDGTAGTKVAINVPYTYMDFQAGTYKYDLQIRKQTDVAPANLEYVTWLYGTFTLKSDITQT